MDDSGTPQPTSTAPAPDSRTRTSTPRTDLERLAWPSLEEEHLDLLRAEGACRKIEAREVLFEVGQESYDFTYLVEGCLNIIDRSNEQVVVEIKGPNFLGELGMLMGQGTFLACVAAEPCRVIIVPQDRLRHLVATVPEFSDVIVTAFAARRRLLLEWGEGGLTIVGSERDRNCLHLLEFASRNRIPHRFVDRADREDLLSLQGEFELPSEGTAVITGRCGVLVEPSTRDVAKALGLDLVLSRDKIVDLTVVGAGPAGLAAAVYGASEGLCTLVVEDTAIGGQVGTSSRIENYLGFATGLSGTELAHRAEIQAVKFGARITMPRRAVGLRRASEGFEVDLDDGSCVKTHAVVLANGVQYRRLPLDRLEELEGSGIYYAATHLEARLCSGDDVVIVGGGNSAGQAAMFLSRHARCTHVVVRGEGLSATMSSYLSQRIHNDSRIRLWTHNEVCRLHGDERLQAVTVCDGETGQEKRIPACALFIMVGAAPNTDWLSETVELDEKGFIATGRNGDPYVTSQPGVWAVGDIRSGSVKRVASAVGEGSVVVASVHRFLQNRSTQDLPAQQG